MAEQGMPKMEPLSKDLFAKGIKELEFAYRQEPLSEGSLKVYYEKLKEIPDQYWQDVVDGAIDEEVFFPAIATLKRIFYGFF
jgi:hypothetical protein